jgi:hypothetical protein
MLQLFRRHRDNRIAIGGTDVINELRHRVEVAPPGGAQRQG